MSRSFASKFSSLLILFAWIGVVFGSGHIIFSPMNNDVVRSPFWTALLACSSCLVTFLWPIAPRFLNSTPYLCPPPDPVILPLASWPSIVHSPHDCVVMILASTFSLATISPASSTGTISEAFPETVSIPDTRRWLALKDTSSFYTSVDATEGSSTPSEGSVLRFNDPSAKFSIFDNNPVSSVYIRKCYITWFNFFLTAVANNPNGKFALSSTPGCGKTFATNFIFKMATITPSLQKKDILYQFKSFFFLFRANNVTTIKKQTAATLARSPNTFYILDGRDADPVISECLTLFISSPRNNYFKDWHFHAQVVPWYFPVWSLDELRSCRELCYPNIDDKTISDRYQQYGGVARYVLWASGDPPALDGFISDAEARRSIRSVGEPSVLHRSSHMLLHIAVDEDLRYKHIVLASRHIGVLLFNKHFIEMIDKLQSMLGAGGALAGHLFECYCHFLFQYGHVKQLEPLHCRSLEGDNVELRLLFQECNIEVFEQLPNSLLSGTYYVPLTPNFAVVDALTTKAGFQFTVTRNHPIRGTQAVKELAKLYGGELHLVYIVPETIAANFQKQKFFNTDGKPPANIPPVKQFVAGLKLGIDTSAIDTPDTKKRRITNLTT